MNDVTHILSEIESGDPSATEQLLPLVYGELRRLAAAKLAQESPGQTLAATALVHEAFIRLVDVEQVQQWDSRGHFYCAAAEAMRRILVESSRRKRAQKHGGGFQKLGLADAEIAVEAEDFDILDLSEAVEQLAMQDTTAAELAKLRIFAGLSVEDAGKSLGLAHTTAYRQWTYTQAWLRARLQDGS